MSKKNVYGFKVQKIDGSEQSLLDFEGKVLLIVNTASGCGFTPQYEGLQKLYDDHKDKGLVVLGFPCNQFGGQEPGSNEEIASFCMTQFSVNFPVFSKVKVNGEDAEPLYKYLKDTAKGFMGTTAIKWNFTKFLVGKDGVAVKRYAPQDTPEKIEKEILKFL